MKDAYVAENAAERLRLQGLTARLSEADLCLPMPNGWTVATKLVHLAFWDQYYLALIRGWERTSFAPYFGSVDALNEAVRVLSAAIPATASAALACAAADAIDRKLEEIAPELAEAIEAGGHVRILRRALHRRAHLDQIERALEGGA